MKIFVVMGKTGEYSDRSEWLVTAYTNEDDAKTHVIKATEYADAWQVRTQQSEYSDLHWREQDELRKSANPMDPWFTCDYTGTSYSYDELLLQSTFIAPETIH